MEILFPILIHGRYLNTLRPLYPILIHVGAPRFYLNTLGKTQILEKSLKPSLIQGGLHPPGTVAHLYTTREREREREGKVKRAREREGKKRKATQREIERELEIFPMIRFDSKTSSFLDFLVTKSYKKN